MLQAYLPHREAAAVRFSPRDADAICALSQGGFDAALYLGIAIAVLGGVGAALLVRHYCAARCRGKYQSLPSDNY